MCDAYVLGTSDNVLHVVTPATRFEYQENHNSEAAWRAMSECLYVKLCNGKLLPPGGEMAFYIQFRSINISYYYPIREDREYDQNKVVANLQLAINTLKADIASGKRTKMFAGKWNVTPVMLDIDLYYGNAKQLLRKFVDEEKEGRQQELSLLPDFKIPDRKKRKRLKQRQKQKLLRQANNAATSAGVPAPPS